VAAENADKHMPPKMKTNCPTSALLDKFSKSLTNLNKEDEADLIITDIRVNNNTK
jgi:hypothetical protein